MYETCSIFTSAREKGAWTRDFGQIFGKKSGPKKDRFILFFTLFGLIYGRGLIYASYTHVSFSGSSSSFASSCFGLAFVVFVAFVVGDDAFVGGLSSSSFSYSSSSSFSYARRRSPADRQKWRIGWSVPFG